MFYLGLLAASQRVPFLPTRAGLGFRRPAGQPGAAHGSLPLRRTARSWWPCRRSRSTPPSCTSTGPTPTATARCSAPTPSSTTSSSARHGGGSSPPSGWSSRAGSPTKGPMQTITITRLQTDAVVEAPDGRPLHVVRARLRPGRGRSSPRTPRPPPTSTAEAWAAFASRPTSSVDEAGYQAAVRAAVPPSGRCRGERGDPAGAPTQGRGLRGGVRGAVARRRGDHREPVRHDPRARSSTGPTAPSRPTSSSPTARRR